MSTNYEFKKIGDVDIIESINDFAHVIIEDSGVLKKMAAKHIGAVKTVNGSAPDADGNVQIEIEAGASSWNDLTDKPFYDNGDEILLQVYNIDDVVFESNTGDDGSTLYMYEATDLQIEEDTMYTVEINNQSFTLKSVPFVEGTVILGSMGLLAPEFGAINEPFLIVAEIGHGGAFYTTIPGETHSIKISKTITAIESEIKPESTVTFMSADGPDGQKFVNTTDFDFSSIGEGDIIQVTADGETYNSTVKIFNGFPVFGNIGIMIGGSGIDITDEPYIGMHAMGMSVMYYIPTKHHIALTIDKVIDESNYENICTDMQLEAKINWENGRYFAEFADDFNVTLENGANYRVICNGTEVVLAGVYDNGESSLSYESETMMFDIVWSETESGVRYNQISESVDATIAIDGYVSGVKKLDKKYLPDHNHEINLPIASDDELGCVKLSGQKIWGPNGNDLSASGYHSRICVDGDTEQIYAEVPRIEFSTTDLTAGVSQLTSGKIYLVYE